MGNALPGKCECVVRAIDGSCYSQHCDAAHNGAVAAIVLGGFFAIMCVGACLYGLWLRRGLEPRQETEQPLGEPEQVEGEPGEPQNTEGEASA